MGAWATTAHDKVSFNRAAHLPSVAPSTPEGVQFSFRNHDTSALSGVIVAAYVTCAMFQ